MSDDKLIAAMDDVEEIKERVEKTICDTYGSKGHSVEGRISKEDFERLIELAALGARRYN